MRQVRTIRGFTLIEVLVALIIIAVGMLGIAKIQALAYASTGTASLRSLAAIEASSLGSAMRVNRGYWAVAPQPLTITIAHATFSATDGALNGLNVCTAPALACTPSALASADLQTWATALDKALPNVQGTISCPPAGAPVSQPIGCTIQIQWSERNTAINTQSLATTMAVPTYTLYVEL